jgi:DNA-binding NarL/FixJ family response regulator
MAVEVARQTRPDVVIMDVTMPRLGGFEATRFIRAELPHTRIIGLSMHDEADMAAAMLEAGAEAYLNKAGPAEDLIEAIRGPLPEGQAAPKPKPTPKPKPKRKKRPATRKTPRKS